MKKIIIITVSVLFLSSPFIASALSAIPWFSSDSGVTIYAPTSVTKGGIGTTTPGASFSVAAGSLQTSSVFLVSTSTASATSTAFIIDSNGNIGIGSTSPYAQFSVMGQEIHGGNYWQFGSSPPLFKCTEHDCLEVGGSDNSTAGTGINVYNTNIGASAYTGITMSNDHASSNVTDYAGMWLNSCQYTDTTFGTGQATKCGQLFQNTMGPMSFFTSTTSAAANYINFSTGGTAIANERLRIINSGNVGIGITAPTAQLHVVSANAAVGASAVPAIISTGGNGGTGSGGAGGVGGGWTYTSGTGGGGNSTFAAGAGGPFAMTLGTGGAGVGNSGANGGNGGSWITTSGQGGAGGTGSGTSNGGNGSTITFTGSKGGNGGGSSANGSGGTGSTLTITTGLGGTGGSNSGANGGTGGAGGVFSITSGNGGPGGANGSGNTNGGNAANAGALTFISGNGGAGAAPAGSGIGGNGGNSGTISFQTGTAGAAGSGGTAGTVGFVTIQATRGLTGVGSSTPFAKLSVNAIAGDAAQFIVGSSTGTFFLIDNAGKIGIGTTTPYSMTSIQQFNSLTTPTFEVATATGKPVMDILGNGHIKMTGTRPTLSSCGTSPSIYGNDTTFRVYIGSIAATGCTITFASTFTQAPICVVTPEIGTLTFDPTASSTPTTLVLGGGTLTSDVFVVHCLEPNEDH